MIIQPKNDILKNRSNEYENYFNFLGIIVFSKMNNCFSIRNNVSMLKKDIRYNLKITDYILTIDTYPANYADKNVSHFLDFSQLIVRFFSAYRQTFNLL